MQNGSFSGGAPVQIGEEVDAKIEAVGAKGDGIARVKGFVIFVPGVNAGDEVRIRITKVLQKVGFGELIGEAKVQTEQALEPEPIEDTEDFGNELDQ
ncbi:TRAM domain-containing protein [Candidatus Woesearchaeota archaeon]|nr:TRAM domain-containing protein [Candidatus Woesearchaeota archaeon]